MTATLRDWLSEKPFNLTMSSGFFGFFAHAGVLQALLSEGLRPSRVSGSSAGALVAGLWASGRPLDELTKALFELERSDFWDPGLGLGLLKGQRFRQIISELLVAQTFEASAVPAAVSAYDVISRRTQIFNSGPLAPAIHASCCVPLLFHPVWIGRRPYLDGGIADRPGLEGMEQSNDSRVLYHHLASRSPWRGKRGAHTRVPVAQGLHTVIIDGLTRSGPSRLADGKIAWHQGHEAMLRALDAPFTSSPSRIAAANMANPS